MQCLPDCSLASVTRERNHAADTITKKSHDMFSGVFLCSPSLVAKLIVLSSYSLMKLLDQRKRAIAKRNKC